MIYCIKCGEQPAFIYNVEIPYICLICKHNERDEIKLVGSEPAFPFIDTGNPNGPTGLQKGLSERDYACIHLKVPKTGKPWLDDLIREAKKDELILRPQKGDEND